MELWQHRNEVVHGKDHEDKRIFRIEEMIKKVQLNLNFPPEVGAIGKHLFGKDILKKGYRTQKDCIRSMKAERKT